MTTDNATWSRQNYGHFAWFTPSTQVSSSSSADLPPAEPGEVLEVLQILTSGTPGSRMKPVVEVVFSSGAWPARHPWELLMGTTTRLPVWVPPGAHLRVSLSCYGHIAVLCRRHRAPEGTPLDELPMLGAERDGSGGAGP